ncbi:MAG: hypothetical protein KC431_29410 [Myxococcales bacterium]|nr:hypothetical protein [Myxococcales bacterium]
MRRFWQPVSLALSLLAACTDDSTATEVETGDDASSDSDATTGDSDAGDTTSDGSEDTTDSSDSTGAPGPVQRVVRVTLDGEPLAGATVIQGGTNHPYLTDEDGMVLVTIDDSVGGDLGLMASHVLARTRGALLIPGDSSDLLFELTSFAAGDNEDYVFNPPGVPGIMGNTGECGHCHQRMKDQWHASPHRSSVSNPVVQDIYAGAASTYATQSTCEQAGGQWWQGAVPGSDQQAPRCYLGAGTLPDLNPDCGQLSACDAIDGGAESFGACADCHAPAIDGALGGRDLLEATGTAFEGGVHCDLCHKVESVDLQAAAGVAGRLRLHRPVEPAANPGVGPWQPLAFGPYSDVPNPRMGASPREHFGRADFCAGCHQLDQPALVPGLVLDSQRWPAQTLPIHTTYAEWQEGPFAEVAPCSSCHMPADGGVGNGADLGLEELSKQGFTWGWLRPPGAVRRHSWIGPRTPASGMLQLAAAVFIDKQQIADTLTATITVRNTGAGHAIPTGEPLRSLILVVQARCDQEIQPAVAGDAIPEFAGWLDRKPSPQDWSLWPGAAVGDVVRVVVDEGDWHDYEGFGPFGDGSFSPQQKGLPRLRVVGQATVIAVAGDVVTFDQPLPPGDLAFRGRPDPFFSGDPTTAAALAGAPGFAFAKVLADQQGATMAPHHRAADVVVDNRILPQQEWSSSHVFTVACAEPIVDVLLLHRPYPVALADERGWANAQQVMVEVSK